jgi:hypothetical protein
VAPRLPDERQLMFVAFDPLHQDGVDLRGLPLSERKLDLDTLCRQSKVPHLTRLETFPDGNVLFDYCNKFGFEGIVRMRRLSPSRLPSAIPAAFRAGERASPEASVRPGACRDLRFSDPAARATLPLMR